MTDERKQDKDKPDLPDDLGVDIGKPQPGKPGPRPQDTPVPPPPPPPPPPPSPPNFDP